MTRVKDAELQKLRSQVKNLENSLHRTTEVRLYQAQVCWMAHFVCVSMQGVHICKYVHERDFIKPTT